MKWPFRWPVPWEMELVANLSPVLKPEPMKPLTADDVLAREVREKAAALATAVKNARDAGLVCTPPMPECRLPYFNMWDYMSDDWTVTRTWSKTL